MSRLLIIGYGNTLRGDDGAGIRAAELVAQRFPEAACVCTHQLLPELAEQIAASDIVVFLDAEADITRPRVQTAAPAQNQPLAQTHFTSPQSLMQLSAELYQRIPSYAIIAGIPAAHFEFSESFSAATEEALHETVEIVSSLLRSHM
jgi:hydrogenase maturation protease